jgi:hypothetical protein
MRNVPPLRGRVGVGSAGLLGPQASPKSAGMARALVKLKSAAKQMPARMLRVEGILSFRDVDIVEIEEIEDRV